MTCLSLFFFFQAEDGIRGWSVTGVQTCALPIYELDGDSRHAERSRESAWRESPSSSSRATGGSWTRQGKRSEERRVGKERRARRGRGNTKKKKRRSSASKAERAEKRDYTTEVMS